MTLSKTTYVRRIAVAAVLLATPLSQLTGDDAIFDVPALLATPLNPRTLSSWNETVL